MNSLLIFLAAAFVRFAYADNKLPPERTHLVTMRKAENMEIIRCVSESGDFRLCVQYARCGISLVPPRAVRAAMICQDIYVGQNRFACLPNEPVFSNFTVLSQIYDCIDVIVGEETPEEQLATVKFEICVRDLYARNCMNNTSENAPSS